MPFFCSYTKLNLSLEEQLPIKTDLVRQRATDGLDTGHDTCTGAAAEETGVEVLERSPVASPEPTSGFVSARGTKKHSWSRPAMDQTSITCKSFCQYNSQLAE